MIQSCPCISQFGALGFNKTKHHSNQKEEPPTGSLASILVLHIYSHTLAKVTFQLISYYCLAQNYLVAPYNPQNKIQKQYQGLQSSISKSIGASRTRDNSILYDLTSFYFSTFPFSFLSFLPSLVLLSPQWPSSCSLNSSFPPPALHSCCSLSLECS